LGGRPPGLPLAMPLDEMIYAETGHLKEILTEAMKNFPAPCEKGLPKVYYSADICAFQNKRVPLCEECWRLKVFWGCSFFYYGSVIPIPPWPRYNVGYHLSMVLYRKPETLKI